MKQCDRGNLEIVGTDIDTGVSKHLKLGCRRLIEFQQSSTAITVGMFRQTPIGFDLIGQGFGLGQVRHPTPKLFFVGDDCRRHCFVGMLFDAVRKAKPFRAATVSQMRHVVGIEHRHIFLASDSVRQSLDAWMLAIPHPVSSLPERRDRSQRSPKNLRETPRPIAPATQTEPQSAFPIEPLGLPMS